MILPDINILVYAHRSDSSYHERASAALHDLTQGLAPFALTSVVCSGFMRLVTNHRIFVEPSSSEQATRFIDTLIEHPNCRMVEPGEAHWSIFKTLIQQSSATANLISDAYIAAIAIEHGCEVLTHDSDFLKFPELKVKRL